MLYFYNQGCFQTTTFLSYFRLKTLFFTFSERDFSALEFLNHQNQNVCNGLTETLSLDFSKWNLHDFRIMDVINMTCKLSAPFQLYAHA